MQAKSYTDVYPKQKRDGDLNPDAKADQMYRARIAASIGLESKYLDDFYVSSVSPDGRFFMTQYNDDGDYDIPLDLAELRGMVMYKRGDDFIKVAPGSRYTKVCALHKPELPIEYDADNRPYVAIEMIYKGDKRGSVKTQTINFHVDSKNPEDKCRPYIRGTYLTHVKVDGEVYTFTASSLDPSGKMKEATWDARWDAQYEEYVLRNYPDEEDRVRIFNNMRRGDYLDITLHEVERSTYNLLTRKRADKPEVKKASYAYGPAFTDTREAMADPANFFPEDVISSPFSYSEILSTPETSSGSKAPVPRDGFVTLVRVDKNWDYEANPWYTGEADEDIEFDKYVGAIDEGVIGHGNDLVSLKKVYPGMKVEGNVTLSSKVPWATRHVSNLTIQQANEILKYGYLPKFSDPKNRDELIATMDKIIEHCGDRSPFGEPIILTTMVDVKRHGELIKLPCSVQLRPPSYHWRLSILDPYDAVPYKSYVYGTALPQYNPKAPKTLSLLSEKYPLFANKAGQALTLRDIETYGPTKHLVEFPMIDAKGVRVESLAELLENPEKYTYPMVQEQRMKTARKSLDDIVDPENRKKAFRSTVFPTQYFEPYTGNLLEYIAFHDHPIVCYLTIVNPSRQGLALRAHDRHMQEIYRVSEFMFRNEPSATGVSPAYTLGPDTLTLSNSKAAMIWNHYIKHVAGKKEIGDNPRPEALVKDAFTNEALAKNHKALVGNELKLKIFKEVAFSLLMRTKPDDRLLIIQEVFSKIEDQTGINPSAEMIRIMDAGYKGKGADFRRKKAQLTVTEQKRAARKATPKTGGPRTTGTPKTTGTPRTTGPRKTGPKSGVTVGKRK